MVSRNEQSTIIICIHCMLLCTFNKKKTFEKTVVYELIDYFVITPFEI